MTSLGMVATVCAALLTGISVGAAPIKPDYRLAASIPLPDGRWDLLSVDQVRSRVFIARGENVTVVDLKSGQVRSVGAIKRGHAAVPVDGTNLVAVTSSADNSLRLFDVANGDQTANVAVGENPDAAIYDDKSGDIIVMNAKGGTVSVVDPKSAAVTATIIVKPGLELAAMVGPGLIAVNDESVSEVELIDLVGKRVVSLPLAGCEGPTGLAFDRDDELLLSACANGKAAITDLRSRKLLQLLSIGKGPDGALYDAARRRFVVPCGQSGILSVFAVARNRRVIPLSDVQTEPGARTAALDQSTGRIYLPVAKYAPAVTGAKPSIVPGSVHLLVIEPLTGANRS